MMAHFAEIDDNNIVTRVLVVDNEHEEDGQNFLANTLGLGGRWIQTSYNTIRGTHNLGGVPLRANFAGVGFSYNEEKDVFIPAKPDEERNWVLNEDGYFWELAE